MPRMPPVDEPPRVGMRRLPVQSRPAQHTPQVLLNPGELLVGQVPDLAVGPDTGLEADLVRVLVSDARHDLLVHQETLQSATCTLACHVYESVRREFLAERIEAEIVEEAETRKVLTFKEMNIAVGATGGEAKLAAGGELKPDLASFTGRRRLRLEIHFAVGSHVEDKAYFGAETENDVLSAPFDGVDGMALDVLGGLIGIQVDGLLVVNEDNGHGLPGGVSGKGVDHSLDVWQLYHDAFILAR